MTIAGRRYKIKSEIRFTVFVTIMILLISMIAISIFGLSSASGMTQQEYLEIMVLEGDTLWNLAHQYMPNHGDIRRAVHTLSTFNSIQAHELMAGQILRIPVN